MAKIPFDITYRPQIESGEYRVETRDGRSVKIIYWDANGAAPIIGLFRADDGCETTTQAHSNGRWSDNENYESDYDLFIITPEPELTEFEKAVKDLSWKIGMGEVVYNNDAIKETAAKLLNLARKQLVEEQYTSDPRKTDLYKLGKTEALKDLPRWKRATCELFGTASYIRFVNSQHTMAYVESKINKGDWFIRVTDLVKLPGFKED